MKFTNLIFTVILSSLLFLTTGCVSENKMSASDKNSEIKTMEAEKKG